MFVQLFAETAWPIGSDFSLNVKTPLVDDFTTPGADGQSIDVSNGNTFVQSVGKTLLLVNNKDGVNALTMTIVTAVDTTPNLIQVIPVSEQCIAGPFTNAFGTNGSTVVVNWATSGAGSTEKVYVIKLP